jgi:hypothetical protein
MSTTALPYEKQIKHFMSFVAVAAETTNATFVATGSNSELVVLGEDGAAPSAGKDLLFLKKDASGRLQKSDLITPKDITYLRGTAPRAKTGRIQTAKVESGIIVGTDYSIDFKIHYGQSEQNFMSFLASARAVTGDTATSLATKIGVELAAQLDRSIHVGYQGGKGSEVMIAGTSVPVNKYFKITQAAGVLTIQEKDFVLTDYIVGLRAFDQLMWNMVTKSSIDTYATISTVFTSVTTVGVYAKGQGYQMKELEHYLSSHVGEFAATDITLGFNRGYSIDEAKSYYTIDLSYSDVSRSDPYKSDKQLLLVCETLEEINKVGNAIADAGGPVWTDFTA